MSISSAPITVYQFPDEFVIQLYLDTHFPNDNLLFGQKMNEVFARYFDKKQVTVPVLEIEVGLFIADGDKRSMTLIFEKTSASERRTLRQNLIKNFSEVLQQCAQRV